MIRSRKVQKDAAGSQESSRNSVEQQKERSLIQEYLAEIGRKGGLKGGKARAAGLSPRKRSAIAKRAAEAEQKLPSEHSLQR